MKEIMKHNNKYVAIFCVVFMLLSFVSFSSFAYTDNSNNGVNFDLQPYTQADYNSQSNALIWGYNSGSTEQKVYFTTDNPIYIFTYKIDSTNIRLAAISETSVSSAGWSRTSVNGYSGFSVESYNSTYNLYSAYPLGYWYAVNESASDIPLFASFDDGIAAVRDWIDNPPIVETPHDLNITLPAGNAIFIQYTSSSTGSISTYFNQAHGSPYSGSNQTMAYVDSIPSSFTSIGNPINWVGNGKTDILGRYRNFTCNLLPNPNNSYLAIVNPYFNSDYVDVEHEDANYEISIHMTNVISAQFVALNSNVVSGSVSNSSSDTNYYTEYDDSTNTWVTKDEDGNPATPSPGGTILPVTSNTINDWLQNISNQIAGFFQGAIGAVSTLVDAGSSFFNVLTGLYSWLPPAVFSVLSSALIVVITIGVIKVFI